MAENTFGSYSGVPTTSAQGQGTAQSFTPQAIGLDTSQIGKGIAQAGLAAAQIGADYMKSQQEIAKKAEEYEKMKGDYNWSNTLYDQNNADISDLVNNKGKVKIGSISEAKKRLDEAINLGKDVQVYEQTWKSIYDKADNNTQVWDPSQNAYVGSKDYAKNKLMNPPTQEELDALKNGNLGIVVNKEILGLDQNLLKADTFDQDVIKAAKDFGLKAGTITTESATDLNSIITSVSQYDATQLDNLATTIKDNQAMKDQFVSQYMLDNGIPPSSKSALMSDPQMQSAWEEKVDGNIDRLAQRRVTDQKISPSRTGAGGGGKTDVTPDGQFQGMLITSATGNGLVESIGMPVGTGFTANNQTADRIGYDKNGQLVGLDASGNIVIPASDFRSAESAYYNGLDKDEKAAYNSMKSQFKKSNNVELNYDPKIRERAHSILSLSNSVKGSDVPSNESPELIMNEFSKLGIDLDPTYVRENIVPSIQDGLIYGETEDGTTVYLPIDDNKSDEEMNQALIDMGATKKSIKRIEGDNEDPNGIATVILDVVQNDNRLGFVSAETLGGSYNVQNLDTYIKKSKRSISPTQREKTVGLMSTGKYTIYEALEEANKMEMAPTPEETQAQAGPTTLAGSLADAITGNEGTTEEAAKDKGFNSSYDIVLGYGSFGRPTDANGKEISLTDMTVDQVMQFQDTLINNSKGKLKGVGSNLGSSAVGKYQIIKPTLKGLMKKLDIKGTEKFTPELQDKLFNELLNEAGLKDYEEGKITEAEFTDNIAQKWASMANSQGEGVYNQPIGKNTVSDAIKKGKAAKEQKLNQKGNPFAKTPAQQPPQQPASNNTTKGFQDFTQSTAKTIFDYESKAGSAGGSGLKDFGFTAAKYQGSEYDKYREGGKSGAPLTEAGANAIFEKEYLSKVPTNYPNKIREQLVDWKFNSGRSITDLLLVADGTITADQASQQKVYTDEWNKEKARIEKEMSENPELWKDKIKEAKRKMYQLKDPDAYEKTWKNRIEIFG